MSCAAYLLRKTFDRSEALRIDGEAWRSRESARRVIHKQGLGTLEPCADEGLAFILHSLLFMVFDRHAEQLPHR